MGLVMQVHILSINFDVENMNLEVNLMEVLLGGSSELLLCWFIQHLHWSWFHKHRLQEVYRRCNWSEHSKTCSCSINLDYEIWTRRLDSSTWGSFHNCIIFNLYYIIINLILYYCIPIWNMLLYKFCTLLINSLLLKSTTTNQIFD